MKIVMMPAKFLRVLFIYLLLSTFSASAQKTTIWIVRHAEEVTHIKQDEDPPLSAAGTKRAEALAKELKGEHIKAIYVTKYKRTGLTARPLAYKAKILPRVYVDTALNVFAKAIIKNFRGENVLVIGHSNTVMKLLEAFGADVPFPSSLDEEDYDMLFKITIKDNGKRELAIDYYGEKHHTNEIPEKYQPEINHPEAVRPFTNY
ncbi:histidine phosphatase family protein [Mucilaginibacter sp. RB4R14]|uniref:phosphoglycerate mutase family protein n=1 Tax=Mucilaginibacter aurantiaciroseus TaxID=2949308 RepID=UPI00209158F7|nr:phosphoglycerate mutase family protein [Mucilaginibacter aurantiaciroseus]MCO5936792.1 histidine phosphatase family protein [Mucilaginibacter aurantiaciroseus]